MGDWRLVYLVWRNRPPFLIEVLIIIALAFALLIAGLMI